MAVPPCFGLCPLSAAGLLTLAALCAAHALYRLMGARARRALLRRAVDAERDERRRSVDAVARQCDATPEDVRSEIHALGIGELLEALRRRRHTAVDVLHTYQHYAIAAHERTNCATRFIAEAERRAAELDESLRADPHFADDKLLFGLPISLKESIVLAGYRSTRGYASVLLERPAEQTGLCVELLIRQGAVPFVHTNVPQMLFSFGCSNPIYGRTNQPLNKALTAGGSSGGEAALISLRGSILGVGGDVGGSIRFPCHFCGVCGLKPSERRITQHGHLGSVPGRQMIGASAGPMAGSVDALEVAMVAWLRDEFLLKDKDPYVAYLPWTPIGKGTKLTIGHYTSFDWFPSAPSCRRAVRACVERLAERGHNLVEFDVPEADKAFQLFLATATVDGGKYFMDKLADDLWEKDHEKMYRLMRLPLWLRALFLRTVAAARQRHAFARLPAGTSDLRRVYVDVARYRQEVLAAWRAAGIDALLCPVSASVAMPHDKPMEVPASAIYSAIFNPLDYCTGTLPAGRVTAADVADFNAHYDSGVDEWARVMAQVNGSEQTVGLPVNVQVVTLPFQEEMCLYVMREIEGLIGDGV